MIEPHHRSFLYAACWIREWTSRDIELYMPCGTGSAPDDVTTTYPDGQTPIGPDQRIARFKANAAYWQESHLAIEEKHFRAVTGIVGDLSEQQKQFVAERSHWIRIITSCASLKLPRMPEPKFNEAGEWVPLRDTVVDVIVGCHGLFGGSPLNRNNTAEALNVGIPQDKATGYGIDGSVVRNALDTYARANRGQASMSWARDDPRSLAYSLNSLTAQCREYHAIWELFSMRNAAHPFSEMWAAYDTGEFDELASAIVCPVVDIGVALEAAIFERLLKRAQHRERRLASTPVTASAISTLP